ncbi:hypothetical protein [Haloprofundus halophilus]|uniref:hypothetical protein n=1 Tax=Haloprofundus halophilus TaxID=2283527 RepID=UPI000E4385E7|nr:hypothetical protein [Haloprofundus halophilus]
MQKNDTRTHKSTAETERETTDDESLGNPASRRTASINTDGSGDPIGVALWVNADELTDIGINPAVTDAVDVWIEDGGLRVSPAGGDGE